MRVRYYRLNELGELAAGAIIRLNKREQRRLAVLLKNGELTLCYQTVIDQALPEIQLEQSCDDDGEPGELDMLESMVSDEVAHLASMLRKEA